MDALYWEGEMLFKTLTATPLQIFHKIDLDSYVIIKEYSRLRIEAYVNMCKEKHTHTVENSYLYGAYRSIFSFDSHKSLHFVA